VASAVSPHEVMRRGRLQHPVCRISLPQTALSSGRSARRPRWKRAGANAGDEVGCLHGPPPLLGGLDELASQFATKTATPGAIPQYTVDLYVDHLRDPAARRASFEYYRTLDTTAEHVQRWRDEGLLTIPVLAIGGQHSTGTMPEETVRLVATDVTGLVIPGAGHFLPEETEEQLSAAVLEFLR
jgi:pimeloyl-ACP methyl ester carboxylesterase